MKHKQVSTMVRFFVNHIEKQEEPALFKESFLDPTATEMLRAQHEYLQEVKQGLRVLERARGGYVSEVPSERKAKKLLPQFEREIAWAQKKAKDGNPSFTQGDAEALDNLWTFVTMYRGTTMTNEGVDIFRQKEVARVDA